MDLILASTSPYRRVLLERLGVAFRCRDPLVDEAALKQAAGGLEPGALARCLAEAKAAAVAAEEPDATVIGGDQLVACQRRILGKPGDPDRAIEQLALLAGRAHELITALAVRHRGRFHTHTDVAVLHMRALTRAEIARYVAADGPIDCAGAYKLEARGIALFERIEAEDHSAITGMPLIALTSILRGLGYAIP